MEPTSNEHHVQGAVATLAEGLTLLAAYRQRATTETFKVSRRGERAYTVENGDGVNCLVEFSSVRTGTCSCPDFARSGQQIATCAHLLHAVTVAWPARIDAYLELVESHMRASLPEDVRPAVSETAAGSEVSVGSTGAEAPTGVETAQAPTEVLAQTGRDGEPVLAPSDLDGAVQAAATATLNQVLDILQNTMPDLVQKCLEQLFDHLLQQVPAILAAAAETAKQDRHDSANSAQ